MATTLVLNIIKSLSCCSGLWFKNCDGASSLLSLCQLAVKIPVEDGETRIIAIWLWAEAGRGDPWAE